MYFTLRKIKYSLSKNDVVSRLKEVEPEDVTKYSFEINEISYPPKQVLSVALGIPKVVFTTMDASNILIRIGFELHTNLEEKKGTPNERKELVLNKTPSQSNALNQFWVYHNWRVDKGGKAIVHKESCSFCNSGKGIHADKTKANGEWIGPFSNEAEATQEAIKTDSKRVESCSRCLPTGN